MSGLGWPRPGGQSRTEVQEYLLATMAAAASRMEATARIQKEAAATLQSLAAHREHDVVIKQLRRVEKAISVLAALPDEREAPLERALKPRRLRTDRRLVSLPVEPLTEREVCVLQHLGKMQTLREIAQELYVSVNTVKSHTQAIYRKLGAADRDDAVRRGKALGILLALAGSCSTTFSLRGAVLVTLRSPTEEVSNSAIRPLSHSFLTD
jgi:DNA-binding NarL/FixJ family response regulator